MPVQSNPPTGTQSRQSDVVVVGGGLAGLTAAAYLGRGGRSVRLVERASGLGGRAATLRQDGFSLNRGAHALYRAGEGLGVLRELGVAAPGRPAPTAGSRALRDGSLFQLPVDTLSLLTTGLFGVGAKAGAARWLAMLPRMKPADVAGLSVSEWLDRSGLPEEAWGLGHALVRVATYANAPERFSAGTALLQIQRALHGVLYVDGGWQTLVDGLAERALASGVCLETGVRAERLAAGGARQYALTLADGRELAADAVVLAMPPREASALIRSAGAAVPTSFEGALPLRAATLDVALTSLPPETQGFILGIDRPLYLSVHSRVAKLAPDGGALVQCMKYLSEADAGGDPDADRAELESLLDLGVPGWRQRVVHVQYLPRMIAAERLDLATEGGVAGRPATLVPSLPDVAVAGDWVQGGSWIADAALGSGKAAARALAETLGRRKAVA